MKEFITERLEHMAETPHTWAVTKEGYVLQILLILEVLEAESGRRLRNGALAAFQKIHPSGNFCKRVGSEILGERLDDAFAAEVMRIARELLAKIEP
jgi:hypothetical protein